MTVQELYTEIGGDYGRVRNLLQMDALIARLIRKLPEDLSFGKLLEGWRSGDRAAMFEGAHALKGVCGNLGLTGLAERAGVVTEECRPGNTPTMSASELDAFLTQYQADYERTIDAIRRFSQD